jgi:hypothetical protein
MPGDHALQVEVHMIGSNGEVRRNRADRLVLSGREADAGSTARPGALADEVMQDDIVALRLVQALKRGLVPKRPFCASLPRSPDCPHDRASQPFPAVSAPLKRQPLEARDFTISAYADRAKNDRFGRSGCVEL